MKTKTGRCNVPCLHLLPSSDDLTNIVFSLAVAFVWLLKKSRFMWLYYLLVFLLLPPFISPWRMGHGLPVKGNQGQYNRGRGSLGPPNLWVSHASYVEYGHNGYCQWPKGQSLQGKKRYFMVWEPGWPLSCQSWFHKHSWKTGEKLCASSSPLVFSVSYRQVVNKDKFGTG